MFVENKKSLEERLEFLVSPLLSEGGIELVALNTRRQGNTMIIEFLVDKPQGGITLDECRSLNQKIGFSIEQENLIDRHYVVEVASPGLDRPLRTTKDFVRAKGRKVRFFLSEPVADRIEHEGIIQRVEEGVVMIESQQTEIAIPLEKINKAKQVF